MAGTRLGEYRLKILPCGRWQLPAPVFYGNFQQWNQWVDVAVYVYLLRTKDHIVLVDSGIFRPEHYFPLDVAALGPEAGLRPDVDTDIEAILRREGVALDDVDTLVQTHLHYDHVGFLPRLRNARIYVSGRGYREVVEPPHPGLVDADNYPTEVMACLRAEEGQRLHLVAEREEILPGLSVAWLGGHSPCSQAVAVETRKGRVVIAGDVLPMRENHRERVPIGLCQSRLEWLRAQDVIAQLGGTVVYSHDPRSMEIFPNGTIE